MMSEPTRFPHFAAPTEGGRPRWKHSSLAHALACLADLSTLGAVGLLVLNDHALKPMAPSWLTGKLSDVAGLYLFPFLVLVGVALLELILPRRLRAPDRAMGLALVLSGLWFTALKATPTSNAWATAILDTVTGRFNRIVADPTDLIALAVLPLTWLRWRTLVQRRENRVPVPISRRERWLQTVSLALATCAALATPAQVFPYSFGLVVDVTADTGSSDILYASLATQRLKMEPATGFGEWNHVGRVSEAIHTIETYRSQDGGLTWELYSPIGGYLWADPHTPGRLYILNEDGLHRLEDGEAALLDVPFEALQVAFFPNDYISVFVNPSQHGLAFDPIKPAHLYLTDGKRLLVSADHGETWEPRSITDASVGATALTISPSAPQSLYAAVGSVVLHSDDGGNSWHRGTEISSTNHIDDLAVHPTVPGIIYAAGNGVYRSLDGGDTWEHVYAESGTQVQAVALHPTHPHLVYAAGSWPTLGTVGRVVFSSDGGDSWQTHDGWEGYDVAISPSSPHHVVLALGRRGVAIQDLAEMVPPTPDATAVPTVVYAYALTFDPRDPGTLYALGGDPPRLGRSTDGGATWTTRSIPVTADDPPLTLASYAVGPPQPVRWGTLPTTLVALGRYTAYRMVWRQATVAVESSPLPQEGFDAEHRLLVAVPHDPGLLVAAGPEGILRSEDGGQTWAFHLPAPFISLGWPSRPIDISALTVAEQSNAVLYAVADVGGTTPEQAVLKSTDGGTTWETRAELPGAFRLESLSVHPSNSDIVYGGGEGLYRSDDGGASWTPINLTVYIRALAIAPGDPCLLHAITDEGTVSSSDCGLTLSPACATGWFDGPAEFLGIAAAQSLPHPITLLAHPAHDGFDLPDGGICRAQTVPELGIAEGWRESSEGLPVFVEEAGR